MCCTLYLGLKAAHRRVSATWEWVGELGNVARHERGLTYWKGGRERSGLVSLEIQSVTKQGLTHWKRGRGRRAFVSLKTWHVTKDSPTGGEGRGGVGL